jgi:hypothetical protein
MAVPHRGVQGIRFAYAEEVGRFAEAGGIPVVRFAYLHTFVQGEETYADGEPADALPGRLIRGAQPAPPPS